MPAREPAGLDEPGRCLLLPEADLGETHERLAWETFPEELDDRDHVVVYRSETADELFEVVDL